MKIIREYNGKATFQDILKLYLENISDEIIEKSKEDKYNKDTTITPHNGKNEVADE
ncbi:hypothetical protein [Wukongibacter sp. M2B1]|uniref:hypothetical protein n=1 Tax=Wukongibacter sp. M2B1 TaxID=3088895 RepID=UPI003D7B01EA